ncbi:hypothetical protein B7P43_G09252, partial [Cryptotermes secundus]
KMRGKVVGDLVRNIPVLSGTDSESVLHFLIRAQEVYDLNLVVDLEFLAPLVGRTSGRVTQILGLHLGTSSMWGVVSSEISSIFLPPRIREEFVCKYVLRLFQSQTEHLTQFIMSVVAAARILSYHGSESDLVQRTVQNMHPRVRSYLVFGSKPTTISELQALASHVAEARAIDAQRQGCENQALVGASQSAGRGLRQVTMAIDRTRRVRNRGVVCWKSLGRGHLKRDSPTSVPLPSSSQGNEQASAVKPSARIRVPKRTLPRSGNSPVRTAGNNPWVLLTIKEYCLPAISDSGSSSSFIRRNVFQRIRSLGLPCWSEAVSQSCRATNGQNCAISLAVLLQTKLHSFSWKYSFLIFDDSPVPCILGADFWPLPKCN